MKSVRESVELFRYNIVNIIIFEIFYKLMTAALLAPIFYWMLNTSIKMSGVTYLTKYTVNSYLKSPVTYIFLILFLIIVAAFTMINLSAMIYAMEASYRKDKINPLELLFKGLKNTLRILYYKNTPMVLYILIILPFTGASVLSASLMSFSIPDYLKSYFTINRDLFTVILLVYIILCFISLTLIYTLNFFTLRKQNFKEAARSSIKCVMNNSFKYIFGILIFNILLTVILYLLSGVFAGIATAVIKMIVPYRQAYFIINSFIETINLVLYVIFALVATPLAYAYICNSYYKNVSDTFEDMDLEEIEEYEEYNPARSRRRERLVIIVVILVALTIDATYLILEEKNIININAEYLENATVTAHRGDSVNAPENTLSAFENAIENQADVIELDVRQTMDGEIIIMHDESLKRTVGIDKKVGEITYDELLEYDAGSWFSENFEGEKVPTLREAVEFIDGRAGLNIELKPADTDINLEEQVVEIVQEYDLYKDCVVTSSDYNAIRNVKLLDEDIKTVYVMSIAVGEFYNLQYADAFSIKYDYITTAVVKEAHKKGKEIYAWTVNSDDAIKDMMLKGVDSIITDNPYNTKRVIYNYKDSFMTSLFFKYFNEGW